MDARRHQIGNLRTMARRDDLCRKQHLRLRNHLRIPDAALVSNINQAGKVTLLALLIVSSGILAVVNESTRMLHMHGRVIKVEGLRTKYEWKLDMVKQLVKESGRDGWALRMGYESPEKWREGRPGIWSASGYDVVQCGRV